ncbi:LuxR C-terminal-related transcriptional regulator [Nocardia mangyaensis]|uniref:LuxR C-terminal-related transcriptional regulator n=1 Tax=Nocardia mangyaensis TaxID=2213200 RepID=UPI0012EB0BFC|nr:LuxR C-terminal-related transcriptional regulator [Nocardia mangyaensis]
MMASSSSSLDFHGDSPVVAVAGHGVDSPIPDLSFAPVRCGAAFARFDRALAADGHTVLLCGPAGSGKTVVLVDWVTRLHRKRGPRVVWSTVTEQLAEGGDLLGMLTRTLDPAPDLGSDGLLRTPVDRAADLIAVLAEHEPTVLVIDDAHLLTDPLQLAGLEFLLTHLPTQFTVLIAGRFDPPLRWHTLDLAARLTRVGATELALSPDRVAQLLAQHGCRLDDAELTVVQNLTRGWAALVRIAAIYLSTNAADRDTALTALARPSHAVADFLVAELLDSLPAPTLDFLLATAVPAQFCLPLAEELAGEDAARIIDELLRANFPLHTVAHAGELWHTYHPLLRAYLLAEAVHTRPERLSAGHRRVAEWFTAAAMPAPALEHVLAEPGTPGLAAFLRDWGPRMVLDGTGHTLLAAVEHVPELAEDTFVRLLRAAVAVEEGDIAAAEVYLEAAHVGAAGLSRLAPADWVHALDQAVSAGVAVLVGDSASTRWPLPTLTGQHDLDCYAALQCGAAEVFGGDAETGATALRHAIVHAEEAGLGRVAVRARTASAMAAGVAGRVGELRTLAAQAVDCAQRFELAGSTEAALARLIAADGAYRQGREFERPLPSLPGTTAHESMVPAPLRQAAIALGLLSFAEAADRAAAATTMSKQVHRLLDESPMLLGLGAQVIDVLWLLLRLQARTDAQQLVDHAARTLGPAPELAVAEAGLAIYTHRPAAAVTLLEPLLTGAPRLGPAAVVTAWLLVAVAADRLDRPRKVDDAIEQALAHADDEQLIRPFLDVPGAAELLDRLGGRFGRFDTFVDRIRAHRGAAVGAPQLTDTELVVLRQLPSGMTAISIAGDLGISVNTVKTHLRGIYQKLGVNARAEAIAQARGLGLL